MCIKCGFWPSFFRMWMVGDKNSLIFLNNKRFDIKYLNSFITSFLFWKYIIIIDWQRSTHSNVKVFSKTILIYFDVTLANWYFLLHCCIRKSETKFYCLAWLHCISWYAGKYFWETFVDWFLNFYGSRLLRI